MPLTARDAIELPSLIGGYTHACIAIPRLVTARTMEAARRGDRDTIRMWRERSAEWSVIVARVKACTGGRTPEERRGLVDELRVAKARFDAWCSP
jgi:hypothetical protein